MRLKVKAYRLAYPLTLPLFSATNFVHFYSIARLPSACPEQSEFANPLESLAFFWTDRAGVKNDSHSQ